VNFTAENQQRLLRWITTVARSFSLDFLEIQCLLWLPATFTFYRLCGRCLAIAVHMQPL